MDSRVTQHTDPAPPYPESHNIPNANFILLNSQKLPQHFLHAQALTFLQSHYA